jgi:hypothetical protein
LPDALERRRFRLNRLVLRRFDFCFVGWEGRNCLSRSGVSRPVPTHVGRHERLQMLHATLNVVPDQSINVTAPL